MILVKLIFYNLKTLKMKYTAKLKVFFILLFVLGGVGLALACGTAYCFDWDWWNCETWFFHEACAVIIA